MTWHHLKQTLSFTMTAILLAVSLAAVLALSQGAKFLSVQSGSMVPVYHRGDMVIARSVAGGNYRPGDVITFINPNNAKQTITHRIVRVVPADRMHTQRFQTKGDANLAADTPVYPQAIIGKVGYSIPHLGTVLDFARQPIGLLLLIYVPALLVIAGEMRRLIAYYKQQEPYVAPGFTPGSQESRQRRAVPGVKTAAKASAVAVIATVSVVVPTVHAALLSSATLSGNTISSVQVLNHLVLSKITFGGTASSNTGNNTNITVITNNPQSASSGNVNVSGGGSANSGNANNSSSISTTITIVGGSNTSSQTTPATVVIYNPTNQPVAIGGWKLQDNSTTQTLPASAVVGAKASYSFAWPVNGGLNRSSDRLILRSPGGSAVDAISWGSDVSQLNPAIATTATTTTLTRTANSDTDKAGDWTTSP